MIHVPRPKVLASSLLLLAVMAVAVISQLPSGAPSTTPSDSPPPASATPSLSAASTIPPEATAPAPPLALRPATEPERDPWTQRLIDSHTPDESKIDLASLDDFDNWLGTSRAGPGNAADLTAAVELATRRRATLKELIKKDPEAAFARMTSSADRLDNLPPEILAQLETPIDETGDWHVQSICFWDIDNDPGALSPGAAPPEFTFNPDGPLDEFNEAVFDAETDKERRYYGFPVGRLGEADTELNIPLRGFAIDDLAVFAGDPPEEGDGETAEAPGESVPGQIDALPFSVKTKTKSLGYRTLLYMRCTFADDPGDSPQSESSAYSEHHTCNNHVIEASYGRMQMLVTVTPLIVLPQNEAFYVTEGTGKLHTDARNTAAAMGYTLSQYSHRVVRYKGGPGSFGGLAQVGADPGNVWMKSNSAGVAVHEYGHNYSLRHSGFWNGSRKSSIGPGSQVEYGHSFDPMGAAGAGLSKNQFCSHQKNRAGWLKGSEWIDCKSSGRFRIAPLDDDTVDPDKRYAIRIDKGDFKKYWLEYRRNFTASAFINGVLLQAEKFQGSSNNEPSLLDVTYWSKKEKNDAGIPLGWTFSDYEDGIHITPVQRHSGRNWIDLQVNLGQFPGNQAPVLILTSNKTTAATGESVQFTASATDADGDELAYHWYYDDNDYHRNQNSAVRNKSWNNAGIYSVVCTVTDMKGGVSVQHIPVTVGSPSGQFTVTGNVDDHTGGGVRRAPVDNNLTQSNSNYRSTITDDDGGYTLTRNVAGNYTFNCRLEGDVLQRSYTPAPYTVGPDASGIDFLAKRVTFTSSPATLSENGGVATFTIDRVGGSTGQFDVAVSFSGAATLNNDYSVSPAPTSGIYTIPSGGGTNLVVTVTGLDDGAAEGPEDIILAMAPVDNLNLTGPTYASLTIDDDDTTFPRLVLAPIDRVLDENGGTAEARITRFGDTTSALTVGLNTGNTATYNTDYNFSHGTKDITIPAGASSAILTVVGLDDSLIEGREPLNITMKNGNWIKDPIQKAALIHLADDDIPEINVTAADGNTGEGNGDPGAIRFTASVAPTSPLDVEYCVRGVALHGTDYAQTTGILTIPAGQTFADIPITGLADSLDESNESAIVRAAAHNNDYTLSANVEATVTVNNKALLAIAAPPADASEFGPIPASYQLTRAGDSDSGDLDVTVAYSGSASLGVDYLNPDTTITIPNGSPSVDIDIDPVSDAVAEGDESITITITPATGYAVGPANQASSTITDLPIDAWRVDKFGANANNPAIAGDLVDPEFDGTSNLLEFGLLLEPLLVDSSLLPPPVLETGFLTLTYTQRKNAGITYDVRWSSSLAPNDWSASGVIEELISQTPATRTVKAKVPIGGTRRYIRVGVGR